MDGITFAEFLVANKYPFIGFIDKKSEVNSYNEYPEFQASDVSLHEEYYYLICAKSEPVINEMIETLKKLNVNGIAFVWKAFCLNTDRADGKFYSIYDFSMNVPWMYYSIYGKQVDREYMQQNDLF